MQLARDGSTSETSKKKRKVMNETPEDAICNVIKDIAPLISSKKWVLPPVLSVQRINLAWQLKMLV